MYEFMDAAEKVKATQELHQATKIESITRSVFTVAASLAVLCVGWASLIIAVKL